MDDRARDEWLEDRQDGRVYPVGRALRSTFDAENHDSLDTEVTGLMIDLSKVPYDGEADPAAAPSLSPLPSPLPAENKARPSVMTRLSDLIARR